MADQPFILNRSVSGVHRQTSQPVKANPKAVETGRRISSPEISRSYERRDLGLPEVVKITKLMLEYIASKNAMSMNSEERQQFFTLMNSLLALTDHLR